MRNSAKRDATAPSTDTVTCFVCGGGSGSWDGHASCRGRFDAVGTREWWSSKQVIGPGRPPIGRYSDTVIAGAAPAGG
jgi:hypothetical protein